MPDKITERLLSRDERALFEIEEKHGRFLLSLSRRIVGSPEDAEEILNDVLLEIWNTVPPKSPESILSYACMLVRRASLDRVRYNTAEKRGGGEIPLVLDELEDCIAHDSDVEKTLEKKRLEEVINRFVHKLPEKDQKVFLCRYFYMDSIESICKQFGFSESKVKSILHRTREKLRRVLREEELA